jgi:hypothetical protein
MQELDVVGVRIEMPTNAPVLVLREQVDPHRVMTLYIGGPEASAIHAALEGIEPPRPLTHDLCIAIIENFGSDIEKVVITEVKNETYYAEIHFVSRREVEPVSARPSDAVALALRVNCPIFVSDDLLELVGKIIGQDVAVEQDNENEIIDEFKDFIENVSPEDFFD